MEQRRSSSTKAALAPYAKLSGFCINTHSPCPGTEQGDLRPDQRPPDNRRGLGLRLLGLGQKLGFIGLAALVVKVVMVVMVSESIRLGLILMPQLGPPWNLLASGPKGLIQLMSLPSRPDPVGVSQLTCTHESSCALTSPSQPPGFRTAWEPAA